VHKNQKIIDSVCTYCGVGCDIAALIEDGQIKKVYAKEDGVVSRGKLCIKGKEGWRYVYSDKRIKEARVKKRFFEANRELFATEDPKRSTANSDYFVLPYTEVYDAVAAKIRLVSSKYGAKSIAGVGGARTSCESSYAFQRFLRKVIGSPHIDNCARVCHSPSLAGLKRTVGEGAATNPFDDIMKAEFLLIIGSNTTEAHPIVANRVLEAVKAGMTLAIMDVREIQLSKKANFQLTIPYESNLLVLNMMAYVILSEKLYNKEFIKKRVSGFDAYKSSILSDEYANPELFLKIKGYESLAIKIKEVARTYAKSRSMILWGLGVTEHLDGSAAVSAIANLALLTGNIGKEGAGLMPLRGQNNVQGTCDMGCLPYYAPDYGKPEVEGLKTQDILESAVKGEMKILYNIGEDLSHIHANLSKVREGLSCFEMIVVHEVIEADMTSIADVVFGVKSAYEKRGVYTNAERRLHLSRPIVESDLPDDWEILNEITKRVDGSLEFASQEALWDEARSVIERYAGATYERLSVNNDGLQWPVTADGDTPRLHLDRFRTADGIAKFFYKKYELRGHVKELLDANDDGFYWLTSGRIIAHYNNASQTRSVEKLLSSYSEDIVLISHEDAKKIDMSQRILLRSAYGQSALLKPKESKSIKKGTLYTTFHFRESGINYLFGDEADEITKTSRFKAVKVEIIQ
jgi:formate dehydrogenase major subunit